MTDTYFNAAIETLSPEAIREMQDQKLREQMVYLTTHSPFYQERLKAVGVEAGDIKSVADLAKLPFTTKQELRDSQKAYRPMGLHAAASMEDIIRVHASSGTTGAPSYVGVTRADDTAWTEAVSRAFWAQGVRPDSVFAMGFSIGFFVGGVPLCNGINNIGATFLPIGTGASDRLVDTITTMGADCLACTPSYAGYLAEYMRDKLGRDPKSLDLQHLLVGAEPGGGIPEVRARLEESWGAKVTEAVGNADVIPLHSAECEHQDGNHFLVPDQLIMEIIDPETGKVLPIEGDDMEGEMVFTHLGRQCAPLLRFRSHDRVTIKTSPCACGRTGPRIKVIGRTDDLLILRGVNVWPAAIKDVVTSLRPKATGEMRVVLDTPPPKIEPPLNIEVEFQAEPSEFPALKKELESQLRQKLIFTANVIPVAPGTLPRTQLKAKLIHRSYEADAMKV